MQSCQPEYLTLLPPLEVPWPRAWDNWISAHSNPLNDLLEAAGLVKQAARIEIPVRIWSVVLTHPRVQSAYHGLTPCDPNPEKCPHCGAVRATFRPVLDRNTFELLLHASAEGPVLPGSMMITDHEENRVFIGNRDRSRGVWIENLLQRDAIVRPQAASGAA